MVHCQYNFTALCNAVQQAAYSWMSGAVRVETGKEVFRNEEKRNGSRTLKVLEGWDQLRPSPVLERNEASAVKQLCP